MKSIPNKSPGDQLFADDWNNVSQELQNAIESTGITLTGTDLFQLSKTISNYAAHGDYYNETGIVNAYLLSPISSKKAPTIYAEGMRVRFMPTVTNTGPSTINVNSLGVKDIVDGNCAALVGGELFGGKFLELAYDGTNFVIIASSAYPEFRFLTSLKEDLILSNNTTDPDHDLDISPGTFVNQDETLAFKLNTTLVKQIDVDWAEGTNDGGFPSGLTLTADTWYHVFSLAKADGTVDAGFDTLLAATNLLADSTPAGFVFFRRIGSVLTDASANILAFYQFDDYFIWDAPPADAGAVPATFTSLILSTPPDVNTRAKISIGANGAGGGDTFVLVKNTFQTVGATLPVLSVQANGVNDQTLSIMTDTVSSIDHRRTGTNPAAYAVETIGWQEINF